MSNDAYERLAQRLDALPNRFPRTESGVELKILRKIFTEEEAEITCALKLLPEAPEQIAERLGRDPEGMGEVLEKMVERGEIEAVGPHGERRYHLIPFVIGIYEFQVNRMDRELAELCEQYFEQGLHEVVGNIKPALLQAIPIEESIDTKSEILPYENVRQLIDKAKVFATGECICRKEQALLDNACDKPLENCITMSTDEHAFDISYRERVISRDEAERIMKEAADAGLVHAMQFITEETYHFCNCCTCCCAALIGLNKFKAKQQVARSNYWASIDAETCVLCGVCADERCPVGAISEGDGGYEVNRDCCIGCGVCVPTCPSESISLVRKPEDQCTQPPSDMANWMMERSKHSGKPLDEFL